MFRSEGSRSLLAWTGPLMLLLAAGWPALETEVSAAEFAPAAKSQQFAAADASDDPPQAEIASQPSIGSTQVQPAPAGPTTAKPTPTSPVPPETSEPAETAAELPSDTLLAYSLASVPDMIGDSLGGRYRVIGNPGQFSIPLAGGDRLAKIADDSNPIPTDRLFVGENYFNGAVATLNGAVVGLNQVTFGFEKTFNDGLWSIEVRVPIDSGLADFQGNRGTTTADEGTVFGNLTITPKILLYQDCSFALSAGLMIDLPTAPAATLNFTGRDATPFNIENRAVYLEPFVGFVYAPNPCLFSIGYLQVDYDASGDPVNLTEASDPTFVGNFRDPALLYVDLSVGRWLFHDDCDCCRGTRLTGIAPVVEVHYTTGLNDATGVGQLITPINERTGVVDLTVGMYFEFGHCTDLAVAACVPLQASRLDREFDSEFIVELNHRF